MQTLTEAEYSSLIIDARVLEEDGFGVKVLALRDGNIIKLFRRKRLISSAAIWPYAQRFANNAKRLASLNIPCPQVIQLYKVPHLERDAVLYQPLPGVTLRHLQKKPDGVEVPSDLFVQLAEFVAKLHQLGVYFRSIHLGNIVLTPEQRLGLIDIADLKTQKRPLSTSQRQRNFKHMLRDAQDEQWLVSKAYGDFKQRYAELTGLTDQQLPLN